MEREERTESREPVAAPSHIIERPRLIELMEESGARVIVLHAPAGYGKTTLARQWIGRPGRRAAWYRCRSSSADIATLARSLGEIVEDPPGRLVEMVRQRVAASSSPDADASELAEIFVENSPKWRNDLWLVLDGYHPLVDSGAAEAFLARMIEGLDAQVVITTRSRPTWILPRQIVYGEFLEVDRTLLAMTEAEARAVLSLSDDEANILIEHSRGWPAVIGLAALLPASRHPASVQPTLLEFLADELYQGLAEEVKAALLFLSLSPAGTREDAIKLLGSDSEGLLEAAVSAGFFSPTTPGTDELHPLLRTFLRAKLESSPKALRNAAQTLVNLYLGQERWDDAFAVASQARSKEMMLSILDLAFEPLLAEGRIATLSRWLQVLDDQDTAHPLVDLAAAELSFREGLHAKSLRLAVEASRGLAIDDPRKAQALIRAGQAAAQTDDVSEARRLFGDASSVARCQRDRREALLGELFAALELESDDLDSLVDRVSNLPAEDLDTDIRRESALLMVSLRTGGLRAAVGRAEPYRHLISRARDPVSRAAFTNALAHACNATSRYHTALSLTRAQSSFAQTYRLNFALPHTLHAEAIALLGLLRLGKALGPIEELSERARVTEDVHFGLNAVVLRARQFLLSGHREQALALLSAAPDARASAGLRAEYLATRAIALLAVERHDASASVAAEAAAATRWLAESTVMVSFVEAAYEIREGRSEQQAAAKVIDMVATTGHLDAFLTAFRAVPAVGNTLLGAADKSLLEDTFSHAQAPDLNQEAGIVRSSPSSPSILSNRELEVYQLLCRGLSNREIAEQLFLSEKTVKVHLRHIYEKLGVRTRTQAALFGRSVLER